MRNFYFFFFLPVLPLSAQVVEGHVVVDFKETQPKGIQVQNTRTKKVVLTGENGQFSIQAELGDTLSFASSFLQTRKIPITPILKQQASLTIHMNQEVIDLGELEVKKPLTGYLAKDVKSYKIDYTRENLYKKLGLSLKSIDLKPKEKRQKVIPRLYGIPIPLSLNLFALYDLWSGKYRRMNNLAEYEGLENKLNEIKAHFGQEFFTQEVKVPSKKIHEFLFFAYENNKEIQQAYRQQDNLTLQILLKKEAKVYLQRLEK